MREKRKGREEVEDGKRNDLIKKYKLKYEYKLKYKFHISNSFMIF